MRIAPGEVTPWGTDIRHEQGVSCEHRISNLMGRVGRSMARHVQRLCSQGTDGKPLVFTEKMVELGAIYTKSGLEIEKLFLRLSERCKCILQSQSFHQARPANNALRTNGPRARGSPESTARAGHAGE